MVAMHPLTVKRIFHRVTGLFLIRKGPVFSHNNWFLLLLLQIGEAAVCFLSRWAADLFAHESQTDRTFTIWRRPGGLDPYWVCAILSSDYLFVRGEKERYDLVVSIIEARRRTSGTSEESYWDRLLSESIYYEHLGLEDLILISRDVSPSTRKPYVPPSVLHAAHWRQAMLKQQIVGSSGTGGSSPTTRDKELGVCTTTNDIIAQGPEETVFFPVPRMFSLFIC